MKTIELADREISSEDFSNFEVNLQGKDGHVSATVVDHGLEAAGTLLRLTDICITYDDSQVPESDIEHFCLINGFRRK
jgi:hypothetical protein